MYNIPIDSDHSKHYVVESAFGFYHSCYRLLEHGTLIVIACVCHLILIINKTNHVLLEGSLFPLFLTT